jgi:hypothetical protein
LCEPPGDRKADHPGTDYNAIDFIHSQFESGLVGASRRVAISPVGARSRSIAFAHYRVVWDDPSGEARSFLMAGPIGRVPLKGPLIMSGQLP